MAAKKKASNKEPEVAEANPAPGPMETNESLNPQATEGEIPEKAHTFAPGDTVQLWPVGATGVGELIEGREPDGTSYAQATVLEDRTIQVPTLGQGDWILGGPSGYPKEERWVEVKVK